MPDFKSNPAAVRPTSATPTVLLAEGLCLRFPQRELFTNLSLRIPPGVSLVRGGESTGKSTLLRLFAGVQSADRGLLEIKGASLRDQPDAYRGQVFWTDARSDAFDKVTVASYLQSQRQLHAGFDGTKLATLVEGLSLTPHRDKPLYMLSTGSRRKVWLAAAFASGAAVTLLDDPFAALDSASVRFVHKLLADAERDTARAYVVAHYEAPENVPLAATIDLGD